MFSPNESRTEFKIMLIAQFINIIEFIVDNSKNLYRDLKTVF